MAHHLTPRSSPRLWALAGLVLVVGGGHVGLAERLASQMAEWAQPEAEMQRLQVAYVREMPFTAPAVHAPAKPAAKRRVAAAPVLPAASAVEPAPEVAVVTPEPAPAASAPMPDVVASAVEPAAIAAATAASEPGTTPFEWPASTRLRYALTGNVRGEVHGQAQVEWIRAGTRYQVHLDVEVGPSFAPLARRRMSSEGDITPDGLVPRRYEQETRLAFDGPYRANVRFDGGRIWLANGLAMVQLPGVQDTASQFVQIAYDFDRQPERLKVGAVVEVLLAMPRNVSAWVYDVVALETLYTPFGELPAYHLKPRREPRAGGDLVTELWIAPQLRHLPVRFLIRQDAENHVDLMLDRRPELAVSDPPPTSPPP